ncbi:MAG: FAD-dependent oxidoreductase [Thermodesulfobacteriota bacterium]|jgi:thioredoxin reductase (NADPH)
MANTYDIVIVGGGAAGFTAGLYAARDRCQALLIERFSAGGQVLNCEHIENYPGFPDGIAGYTLGPLLQQHATSLGLDMQLAEVQAVRLDGGMRVLQTDNGEIRTKTLIIATGSGFTTLGVPGEGEFLGKGVSHCAACDGAFFLDRPVAVIGGGDAALDEGLHLTQYASHVTVIHRRDTLRACRLLQERARAADKLTFRWNTVVRAIEGSDVVRRIRLEDVSTGEQTEMEVAGVFIYVGLTPNTQFLRDVVPLNERGQIVTDLWMRTAVPGILAAGDVRHESARQLIAAAGDGATAALAAIRYLRTGEWQTTA